MCVCASIWCVSLRARYLSIFHVLVYSKSIHISVWCIYIAYICSTLCKKKHVLSTHFIYLHPSQSCLSQFIHVLFMYTYGSVVTKWLALGISLDDAINNKTHRVCVCLLVSTWVPFYWNETLLFRSASTAMETHETFIAIQSHLNTAAKATTTTTGIIKLASMYVQFGAGRPLQIFPSQK